MSCCSKDGRWNEHVGRRKAGESEAQRRPQQSPSAAAVTKSPPAPPPRGQSTAAAPAQTMAPAPPPAAAPHPQPMVLAPEAFTEEPLMKLTDEHTDFTDPFKVRAS